MRVALILLVLGAAGCKDSSAPGAAGGNPTSRSNAPEVQTIAIPEFRPHRAIEPGVQFLDMTVQRDGKPMRIWLYLPDRSEGKLPLVLVPPAGSTLVAGMQLSEGDRPEHIPYVKARFAVGSFDIDGAVPEHLQKKDAAILKAARDFRDARAGVLNVQAALDVILAKMPGIDPGRIAIAGHSSAATLALLAAENEPRIKACAAYAPVTDVEARLSMMTSRLEGAIPGYTDFLHDSSPKNHVDKLTCPVFLFHAEDDNNVPIGQSRQFVELLKKSNPNVTFVTTKRGGHSESMTREGMPKGIEWLKQVFNGTN
jgi:dipeptidyl aminopeptidase/acylaminoacyl peptidase